MIRKFLMAVVLMLSVIAGGWAQEKKDSLQTQSKHIQSRVEGNTTECWDFPSLSFGWHKIYVVGDGDTDLSTNIYKRDLKCYSCDWTILCNCGVESVHTIFKDTTDQFKVCVRNLGDIYNEYELIIE